MTHPASLGLSLGLSLPHLDQRVTQCVSQGAREGYGDRISDLSELLYKGVLV